MRKEGLIQPIFLNRCSQNFNISILIMTNIKDFSPLISFIIPAYNVEKYIEKCVQSVARQTYENIEIIVVNDGSSDSTKELIDKLVVADARIKPVNILNKGVSEARNLGIQIAQGDYLVFVDADDYLAADYAEYMINLVRETNGDFCLSTCCYTKAGEDQSSKVTIDILSPEDATALLLSPRIIVGCWNKIFKKSFIIDNGLEFSTNLFYGEGLHFITKASQLANCVGVGNRKVYYYRRNNYSSATTKFNIDKIYNGIKALDMIEADLLIHSHKVITMLNLHKCLFRMGAVVRIRSYNKQKENKEDYKRYLSYIKIYIGHLLLKKSIPLYRKGLLIGCCISPTLMSVLDDVRRNRIAINSVE